MNDNNMVHWPSFFWSTPELIRSYADIPIVKNAMADPKNFKFYYYSEYIKKQVYHAYFPDLEKREKYHGYEKFHIIPLYKKLVNEIINYESLTTKLPYSDFLSQLDNQIEA